VVYLKIYGFYMSIENSNDPRSIFELSDEEAAARFQKTLDKLMKELFAKGLPISYQDDRCNADDLFIHEYEDGRLHLVRISADGQSHTLVKDLTHAWSTLSRSTFFPLIAE